MDEEIRQAIFNIRDSLADIRQIMREQKTAQERAVRESGMAKLVLDNLVASLPGNLKTMMEPLVKKEG